MVRESSQSCTGSWKKQRVEIYDVARKQQGTGLREVQVTLPYLWPQSLGRMLSNPTAGEPMVRGAEPSCATTPGSLAAVSS